MHISLLYLRFNLRVSAWMYLQRVEGRSDRKYTVIYYQVTWLHWRKYFSVMKLQMFTSYLQWVTNLCKYGQVYMSYCALIVGSKQISYALPTMKWRYSNSLGKLFSGVISHLKTHETSFFLFGIVSHLASRCKSFSSELHNYKAFLSERLNSFMLLSLKGKTLFYNYCSITS